MLTAQERQLAAQRALTWPVGEAPKWFLGHDFPNDGMMALELAAGRLDLRSGCPAVAVAEARGELDLEGLRRAWADLREYYCPLDGNLFLKHLDKDPKLVAEGLCPGITGVVQPGS